MISAAIIAMICVRIHTYRKIKRERAEVSDEGTLQRNRNQLSLGASSEAQTSSKWHISR
jgi:hypothetical protein